MSEEPVASERQITGDEIISEILRNSSASQFALRRSVLLPSIFYVYLHPTDLDYIRPVLSALITEVRVALAEQMEELNRKGKPSSFARMLGFEGKGPVQYKIADADWTVQFYPDTEERLERGDIEIHSELASTPRPEFDGAVTRHVTRRLTPAADAAASAAASSLSTAATTAQVRRPSDSFGVLRYTDEGEQKEFVITKSQIVIGRGGKTYWVDVRIASAPPDVSREHCRLRRDDGGRFHITDTSQFGTLVNGTPVSKGPGETPLPPKAVISLAGVFELDFEAKDAR